MRLLIICKLHNGRVGPAGDQFNWMPTKTEHMYKLDEGDLYCHGGEGDHRFVALIYDEIGCLHANVDLNEK